MNALPEIPDFKGMTKEKYYAMVSKFQQRIEQLEALVEEEEKELAELSARKAYLDEIKKK
jgi:CHASE3 domain sensor protein